MDIYRTEIVIIADDYNGCVSLSAYGFMDKNRKLPRDLSNEIFISNIVVLKDIPEKPTYHKIVTLTGKSEEFDLPDTRLRVNFTDLKAEKLTSTILKRVNNSAPMKNVLLSGVLMKLFTVAFVAEPASAVTNRLNYKILNEKQFLRERK